MDNKTALAQALAEKTGLPAQDLAHIFQRFYRGDATRARNGSFGLGLAIAQSIVLRHRGRIWATSGQGVNTFQVELPVA